MARLPVPFNFDEFDAMIQFGPTLNFCAEYFGISGKTIENRIKDKFEMTFASYKELKMDSTRHKLQQKAIQMALSGDRTMLIFCLKNICKWADKVEAETFQAVIQVMVPDNAKDI